MFTYVCGQSFGQPRRSALTHLRHMLPGKQRRNAVSESFQSQVDLAQTIKKKQPCPNGVMTELSLHKFQGRTRCHPEKFSAHAAPPQKVSATLRAYGRGLSFGEQDSFHDGSKFLNPVPQ